VQQHLMMVLAETSDDDVAAPFPTQECTQLPYVPHFRRRSRGIKTQSLET
jgi:hypothetical protein